MKFYNREDELQELHHLRNTPPSMVVLTGRRRVGKTELIKKFLEDSTGVYFFVDSEKSEKMLINEFSGQLKECFDLGEYVRIEDWEMLLKLIFDISRDRDVIVCVDEFQRFLQLNPSFINQLQKYWDMASAGSRVFFVLSGSSVGMMNRIFVEQNAPLFRRAQNILFIEPFDFKTINSILIDSGIADATARIEMYALFGGMIHYYTLLEHYGVKSAMDAINKLVLRKFAPLKNEVRDTMIESFGRDHRTYYSILTAIALGKSTKSEIANFVDVKVTSLSRYMDDLMNTVGVVQRLVPVTEPAPWRSKKGRYLLNDNFFLFWFRFIFRNMSHHELGDFEYIGDKVRQGFDSFVGRNFVGICREFLVDLNRQEPGQLPFRFDRIGSWWNRKGDEIDIVALNSETGEILFAECKWRAAAVGCGVVEDLRQKARLVDWRKGDRCEYFAMFSKSGFDAACWEYCEEDGVLMFDADQIAGTAEGK
jgi:AAA+ ATPase superfamily predicted ATPase